MACTSLAFPICRTSSASNAKHIFRAQNHSYCINHIHAASAEPNNTLSLGSFPFQMSRNSIIPSFLRKQGTKIHMNMMENFGESPSDEGQEAKSANWVDRLVELGGNWRNVWQQKEVSYHGDDFCNKGENGDCADPESFSRFLVRVPWSSVKLYSKLAFLCNMAYVIPDVKAKDLKKYYGLQFVTSSFEKKAETEKDFRSLEHSSPCEWFVCDDSSSSTRCFVIQGLDSKASWQAYLLFEPTKFEGTNVLVHRGIYEAAQQMYEQCMPEILDHLERKGGQAKLQFTGHCLGGSIAFLVHLMLLTRNLVKPTTLHPVVTFGSSFVFCEGQILLDQLGLNERDHIHCVMMPRDIVPRAFSSNYGNQVAAVLRGVHSSFQSLPCLMKHNMLYSPVGVLIILQPDENLSPPHPLLPMGNAIYALDKTQSGFSSSVIGAFLNTPHPLETLSDPAAYGSEGTIKQDHDSSHYLKAINNVLRQHSRMVVRKMRKQRNLSWPLLYVRTWNHEDESKM